MIKSQSKHNRRLVQVDLVEFIVRKSGNRFLAKRVRLRNNIFTRFREMFLRNRANLKALVKKSVRVDDDIYDILFNLANNNDKEFFTKIINSAVVNKISTEQVDLIDARCFKHKVTVYFTQEEYRRVQDVLNELRSRKITGVTFSSLVRSILYKHLGVVQEIEHNMKPIEEVA